MFCARKRSIIGAAAIFICAGCTPVATPTPTPSPQSLGVTQRYLGWASSTLSEFQADQEGANFILEVYPVEAGLEAVEAGEIELFMAATEPGDQLFATPLLQDGIAVIHHPDITIRGLSVDDLRRIFSGSVQSWREMGGEELPILPVIPPPGDDLRAVFEALVLGTSNYSSLARLQATTEQTIAFVQDEPGTIAFIPVSQLEPGVDAFRIESRSPSTDGVAAGRYPLTYVVSAVARTEPEGPLRAWLGWVQSR